MGIYINVTKNYYSLNRKNSSFLLDVNFDADNEIVVLFGGSGSGKTTTLRCVAGIDKPDNGKIIINDKVYFDKEKNINIKPQMRNLGYVFQNYALFPHMNVWKNIEYGLKHLSEKDKKKRIEYMLQFFNIEHLVNHYPDQLSGGQQQRVALARALAPKPDILLLDEPFSALDMIIRNKLREKIKLIQNEFKIPVLFITHSPQEAFAVADKIVAYHNGHIQQIGTAEDIFYKPCNIEVAKLVGVTNIFTTIDIEKINIMKFIETDTTLNKHDVFAWGIRPENIHIHKLENRNNKNNIVGQVKSVINRGSSWSINFKLKSEQYLTSEISNKEYNELNVSNDSYYNLELKQEYILFFSKTNIST